MPCVVHSYNNLPDYRCKFLVDKTFIAAALSKKNTHRRNLAKKTVTIPCFQTSVITTSSGQETAHLSFETAGNRRIQLNSVELQPNNRHRWRMIPFKQFVKKTPLRAICITSFATTTQCYTNGKSPHQWYALRNDNSSHLPLDTIVCDVLLSHYCFHAVRPPQVRICHNYDFIAR